MPAVDSSVMHAVEHDPRTSNLTVHFHSGAVYRYEDVPADLYEALLAAESKGRFFAERIRGCFPYGRLR